MRQKGPVNLILALNFYAEKKAEFIALEYAQAYAKGNPDSSVLIVLTDNGLKRKIPKLPSNIMIIDLTNETPDVKAREDYLFLIIRMVPLKTLHIVNSIIAYNLLKRLSNSFLSKTNVLASVYSLQYDWHEDTKIIDYGAEFLPENIDKIDCIVTDNQILTVEGPLKLGIVDHSNKFRLVYNKSKLDQVISIDDSFSLLKSRLFTEKDKKKLIVHWAGPIERSQRPDLLVEIATLTEDFCEFQVFPSSVFDEEYEALLRQCRNINFREAYISSLEWDAEEKGNVFLFTSRQEGMPDPLIDASYLGYPVIASNVGGVGELINSETGWPIDKFAPATVYVDALKQIFNNHDEANKRTERLIKLVHSRHNINAYLKALAQIPGYERV